MPTVSFPFTDTENPFSEHDKNVKLFAWGFPWLFPGGVGDLTDIQNASTSVEQWCKQLLHCKDGRFAKDKMWCFCALNTTNRRKNDNSGSFFVNTFHKNGPQSFEGLKKETNNGDLDWINRIMHFS